MPILGRAREVALTTALAGALAPVASGDELADRALAFRSGLPASQRDEASFSFDSSERADVHYAPIFLDGLEHGALAVDDAERARALLAVALSERGYALVDTIRNLELDVRAQEGGVIGFVMGGFRDPGRYLWALFGEPSATAPWGFRFEGHHLSLNVTAVPGSVPATTPLFLGAQPRRVPEGLPSAGVAALGEEERLARALYQALSSEQRARATLPFDDDRAHMVGEVSRLEAVAPVGLPRADMNAEQQALLDALVDRFASLWSPTIATARRAEVAAARPKLHFAFTASDEPANAFYLRISGGDLLIEIDNTSDGDHVHAVWHRPGADFADDLLATHYARHHGRAFGFSLR